MLTSFGCGQRGVEHARPLCRHEVHNSSRMEEEQRDKGRFRDRYNDVDPAAFCAMYECIDLAEAYGMRSIPFCVPFIALCENSVRKSANENAQEERCPTTGTIEVEVGWYACARYCDFQSARARKYGVRA